MADQLHVLERNGEAGETLPVRHGAVERGARRGEEARRRLLAPSRQLPVVHPEFRHRLHPRLECAERGARLMRQRRGSVAQHLRVGRQRRRVPLRRQLHDPRPGRQVEERRQDRPRRSPRRGWRGAPWRPARCAHPRAPRSRASPTAGGRGRAGGSWRRRRRRRARTSPPGTAGWPGSGGRRGRIRGRRPRPGGAGRRAPARPAGAGEGSGAGAAQ